MAQNIHQLVEARRSVDPNEPLVLATIIHTEGSSYQKAGARMLIRESGELLGILAGGCFEGDLRERAQSVFNDGQARVIVYDMRSPSDAIWGLGLGCNGAVHVLLQRLTSQDEYFPLTVFDAVCAGDQHGILATVCQSDQSEQIGQTWLIDNTQLDGLTVTDNNHPSLQTQAQTCLLADKPMLLPCELDGTTSQIFFDPIKPPNRLLILGAGPDAVPLTRMAAQLGWRVTLVDHRPANVKAERFPDAEAVLHVIPPELNDYLDLNRFDALLVMTHSIDYDERYLRQIGDSQIPYIGLLGPAHRRNLLLQNLGEAAEKLRDRAFGPVGLDIGANTPEEIALSILAEIQAVSAQRNGGRLCLRDAPMHDQTQPVVSHPSQSNIHAVILAAGASRRFGSPKQLAGWNDGTLIQHCIETAQSVFGSQITVVIGAHQDRIETSLKKQPVNLVKNAHWPEGIASSIRAGIAALPDTAESALVMLCDQPLITAHSLQQLVDTWKQHPDAIVASEYSARRGVPALFPSACFVDLLNLQGDQGARHLLNQPNVNVIGVTMPEAATDIDTPEDFEQLQMLART